jgi:hypothetical protein
LNLFTIWYSEISEAFPPSAMREPTGAKRVLSTQVVIKSTPAHSPKSDGSKHQGPITNTRRPTSMNYDGAEGLEFGGGNTKVDPSVAAGQL